MLIQQLNQNLIFTALFTSAGQAASGRTVTVTVISPAGTKLVTAAAATELASQGVYTYTLASSSVTTAGMYVALFSTADLTVNALVVQDAAMVGSTWVQNIDSDLSALQTIASAAATATGLASAVSPLATAAGVTAATTPLATATSIAALNNLSSAQVTTAAQLALTNQGLTMTQVTALTTFLGAYATTLATQTQASNILAAITALPAPANSTIASIWSEVQSILTDVTGCETSADITTKYTALQTAISGVVSTLGGDLTTVDNSITTVLADLSSLATNIAALPTASSIETAVWASMPSALQTLLGWTPGQVTGYATGQAPASVDVAGALSSYGAAKTSDVTEATSTIVAAMPIPRGR